MFWGEYANFTNSPHVFDQSQFETKVFRWDWIRDLRSHIFYMMDNSMKTVNSAISLALLILITASNVHAEKSLREKFSTGDTSSSSSEQTLKEQFQTQDLTITPEYRVLSQKEAWESITPAKDLLKTWKRCCQTNENSHQIAGAAWTYALNSWRHSARAAVRLSLKVSRE